MHVPGPNEVAKSSKGRSLMEVSLMGFLSTPHIRSPSKPRPHGPIGPGQGYAQMEEDGEPRGASSE